MLISKAYKRFTNVNLIFSFCTSLFGVILAPYLLSVGYLGWQISLIFTALPFVNIIFLPFFGKIADVINRRIMIWIGISVEIVALFLYLIPYHWSLVVTARLLDAVAASLVSLIILAKIEDNIAPKSRGYNTGKYLSISYLGVIIGPLFGAWLADYYFIQAPFVIAIIILFILIFWLLITRSNESKGINIFLKNISWLKEIKLFLSHRKLKGMGILGMVMHASNPAMNVFLPILIITNMGLTYRAVGLSVFFYGFTHILQHWWGRLGDKYGQVKIVFLGTLIVGISLIALSFIGSYLILLVVLIIMGTGAAMWNVSAWSLMSEVGEKEKIEAQVLTSYTSIAKIGALFSFILSAWVVKIWGLEIIFIINGIVIIAGNFLVRPFFKKIN